MTYHFRLDHFEGPLDLLLSLIERERLDITTVSLAQITDQYFEYLSKEEQVTLENLSAFLSVASRLLLIKSRALLPVLKFTEEEEDAIDDLEWRLQQYKLFRDAGQKIGQEFARHVNVYARESFLGSVAVFYPPKHLTIDDIARHFRSILGQIAVPEILPEKSIDQVVSLEERIGHLERHMVERIETSFADFSGSMKTKIDIIVSFLALLELVKQRIIIAEQQGVSYDIRLRRAEENPILEKTAQTQ